MWPGFEDSCPVVWVVDLGCMNEYMRASASVASCVVKWVLELVSMYVVESKGGAIVCMLVSLLFLGTWPAVMTMLERRGRLPQHTYLDYTLTNLLAAVIIAFTFGEIGNTAPNFLSQLHQVQTFCIWTYLASCHVSIGFVLKELFKSAHSIRILHSYYLWCMV